MILFLNILRIPIYLSKSFPWFSKKDYFCFILLFSSEEADQVTILSPTPQVFPPEPYSLHSFFSLPNITSQDAKI